MAGRGLGEEWTGLDRFRGGMELLRVVEGRDETAGCG